MKESIELRWFFDGITSEENIHLVEHFAKTFDLPFNEKTHSEYFLKHNRETVGIKLMKDGSKKDIELKFLRASVLHQDNEVSGHIEQWRKWDFPEADWRLNNKGDIFDADWVLVDQVTYSINIPVPGIHGSLGLEGCIFGITSISTERGDFWTLGFEAYSNSGNEESNFFYALKLIDLSHVKAPLTRENSFSYAKFINASLVSA